MNIPKAYISGFQKAVKSPRMVFILYFSNLALALLLALPFMNFLQNSFGDSMLFENLLDGFDFTSFSNLNFYNGDGISAILASVKWLFIAYFLMNVFLTGGIIRTLNKEKFTTANFFAGGAYNFFRFLGLSIIVIIVQFFVALLVYIPLGIIFDSLGDKLSSEVNYYYYGIGGFVLHLLLFLLISMIGDYAKFNLVLNDSFNIFKGFWKGFKYTFKHFLKTYFLYLFLLILPAVVMYIYLYYESDMKMATGVGILIVFAMQQGFILLRVFLRVWILASQFKIYSADFIKSSAVQDLVFGSVEDDILDDKKIETIVEEEVEENTELKTSVKEKTNYEIDFSKTFDSKNPIESDEQTLTEEEMLKKMQESGELEEETLEINEEEATIEASVIKSEKETIYDEEEYKEEVYDDDIIDEDDTEEEAELIIEEDDDEHQPELIHISVTSGLVESPVEETDEEIKKSSEVSVNAEIDKTDDDIIEFEL